MFVLLPLAGEELLPPTSLDDGNDDNDGDESPPNKLIVRRCILYECTGNTRAVDRSHDNVTTLQLSNRCVNLDGVPGALPIPSMRACI